MIRLRSGRGALLLAVLGTWAITHGFGFGLQDALARADESPAVRSAAAAVAAAHSNLDRLEYAGDFSLSGGPQAKATTEFTEQFPEQTVVSGTLSAKLPLGLSNSTKLQVKQARAALETAQQRLAQTKDLAYEAVYALYMTVWLTQEEQRVIASELEAARAYSAALEEQFQSGKISLVDLRSAEDDLRRSEAAASKGKLDHRLSWLRLATALGLPFTPETPNLSPDPQVDKTVELPKPPELVSWALERDIDLQSVKNEITGVEDRLSLLRQPDLSSTLQLSGGVADHSFSLSYTFDQPQLAASYAIPFYSQGTIPGSNSANLTSTWNVGMAFSLSLALGKGSELETESLRIEQEQNGERLAELRGSLQLDIRSRYQEWLTSVEEVGQAQAALARAETNRTIVESRRNLGLASDYEVLQVQALSERARFAVSAAQSTARVKFLAAANAAGYLGNVLEGFEKGGTQ